MAVLHVVLVQGGHEFLEYGVLAVCGDGLGWLPGEIFIHYLVAQCLCQTQKDLIDNRVVALRGTGCDRCEQIFKAGLAAIAQGYKGCS